MRRVGQREQARCGIRRHSKKPGDMAGFALLIRGFGVRVPAARLTPGKARIGERRGRNIATVAVARKLLTLAYYGLRDGRIRALAAAKAVG